MSVKFFEDSRALESLRHSDFDAYSAYGEVIDNSLQAEAKNIHISFEVGPLRNRYLPINSLVFGDDGIGMDEKIKKNGLGVKLTQTFIKQLKGTIEKLERPGTMFKIVFEKID